VQQSVWHDEDLHATTTTPARSSKPANDIFAPRPSEIFGEGEWEFGLKLSRGASGPAEEQIEKNAKSKTITLGRKVSRRLRAMKS